MKQNVRIGMLGSGFVADFYMQGLANVNGQDVVVNYSRSAERAQAFAARWDIPESCDNLPQVVARDDIDLFITFQCRWRSPRRSGIRYAPNLWAAAAWKASQC